MASSGSLTRSPLGSHNKRWTSISTWTLLILYSLGVANAQRVLHSTSFSSCQDNSTLTASTFDAWLDAGNQTLTYNLVGVSSFSGNVTIEISLTSDGKEFYSSTMDPCDAGLASLCPSSAGQFNVASSQEFPLSYQLPQTLFIRPDAYAMFRYQLNNVATDQTIACVEARLENNGNGVSGVSASSTPSATTSVTSTTTSSGAGQTTASDDSSSGSSDDSGDSNGTGAWSSSAFLLNKSVAVSVILIWLLS